jgi:hypothetical protein
VIDPTSSPVDFWLECCEPRVAQDYFVFSQVRQEESECSVLGSCLDLKISEELKFSALVQGAIDIK